MLCSFAAACSGDDDDGVVARDAGVTTRDAGAIERDAGTARDAGVAQDGGVVDGGSRDGGSRDGGTPVNDDCDPLMPTVCSFPWPSNLYLAEDAERVTGYTLRFGATTLPASTANLHVNPAPYERMDGYGPGQPIMVHFPNLDASGLPDETDIGASLAADANILLYAVDGASLRRVPYFAELDAHEADPAVRVLFVRPAVLLDEETRYVVAMRGLVDTDGAAYAPSDVFARLVANDTDGDPALASRQARFDEIFTLLQTQNVTRAELLIAWDFVVASSDAMHGRLLAMRDEALTTIGADGPPLKVTSTQQYVPADDGSGLPVNENTRLRITGTMTVPSYLTDKNINGFRSTVLNLDANGDAVQNGTRTLRWWMLVPHSTTSTRAHGILQYGHGLLGSGEQTWASHNAVVANTHDYIYFGTNFTGFDEDMQLAVGIASRGLSGFEWIADTLHQGMIDALMLGRTMQRRIAALPELANVNIDTTDFHYSGISQGGIFGGTYMALSTDVTRGHLGVPGTNYSLLLHRSVDFAPFFSMIAMSYPSTQDQAILLAAIQLLWDSTDSASHYRHIVDEPYANTPTHQVILAPAKGDHQVAVIANEIVARTDVGIPLMENYDDERTVFGVTPASYPRVGSGVVLYDFGNAWPAPGNSPPTDGADPHGQPRRLPAHNAQMTHFFRTGVIVDVCGGDGCHPD